MLIISMASAHNTSQTIRQGTKRKRHNENTSRHGSVQIGLQIGKGRNHSGLSFISGTFQRRQTGQTIGRAHSRHFTFTQTTFAARRTSQGAADDMNALLVIGNRQRRILAQFHLFLAGGNGRCHDIVRTGRGDNDNLADRRTDFRHGNVLAMLRFAGSQVWRGGFLC